MLLLLLCVGMTAQVKSHKPTTQQEIYNAAVDYYQMGQFNEAVKYADELLANGNNVLRTGAYRILALCALENGDDDKALKNVQMLLSYDPNYSPSLSDPRRFRDMINSAKAVEMGTITTASQRAETLEESPVPVTVITEEMIIASGAQTLRDLLCLYVPTMTRVEGMEANVCMRGIVGNTQEDILIMLDGHKLNSSATNAESPDFRNSLHKIKQIEVLRGPASSLYGNVALMAVVNIITKKGYEVDGVHLSGRYGSYNTYGGDVLYGRGNAQSDIMAWGSMYNSDGEKVMQDGTPHFIDGYRDKPAYDLGLKGRWGKTLLTFTHQHSKPVPYYNQITLQPYTYERFSRINGNKPGAGRSATNLFIDYNHSWNDLTLSASIFGNYESTSFYNALGDGLDVKSIMTLLDITDPQQAEVMSQQIENVWLDLAWEDFSAGANVNLSTDYRLGSQHGSLLVGVQEEYFNMSASNCSQGFRYKDGVELPPDMPRDVLSSVNDIIGLHTENTSSFYMQLKNYITPRFIFNGGARYDHKRRYDETIKTMSPRVALIWTPTETSNIKLNYAHSFVDAPYLYRSNQLSMYGSHVHLNPQKNDAFQLTGSKTWPALNLKTELNLYYNNVRDLCIFSYSMLKKGDASGAFSTANVEICGAEGVLEYKTPRTLIHMNMSYKYPIKMKGYSSYEHKIGNEPAFMVNIVANQRLFSSQKMGMLWLHANMHFQTDAEMEVNYLSDGVNIHNEHCPAQALFNAGVNWNYRRWNVSLDAYNVLNSDYRVGAQLQCWIPSQGFKFVGKVAVRI